MRRAEKTSVFVVGIALQLVALCDCSYHVPSLLERKTIEAQLLPFLQRLYFLKSNLLLGLPLPFPGNPEHL